MNGSTDIYWIQCWLQPNRGVPNEGHYIRRARERSLKKNLVHGLEDKAEKHT